MDDRRMLYLRTLFLVCPGGTTAAGIASLVGESEPDALAYLEALWRDRKAARIPNPRGRGYLWRTPSAADDMAGFLFEGDGQPVQIVDGVHRHPPLDKRYRRTRR